MFSLAFYLGRRLHQYSYPQSHDENASCSGALVEPLTHDPQVKGLILTVAGTGKGKIAKNIGWVTFARSDISTNDISAN